MRVLICGFGHVGSVTAACLLADGHEVIAADTDAGVRALAAKGQAPVGEPMVEELLKRGLAAGRLSVSLDLGEMADADVALVCVGTDAAEDGLLRLDQLDAAVRAIGTALRLRGAGRPPAIVAVRSTILPGTMAERVLPVLEAAVGEGAGLRYEVAYNPEFMREGSGVADFRDPSRIVIGGAPSACARLLDLYRSIPAPRFETSFEVAEAIKFADNSFHALKVAFANEIGRFAVSHGIDPGALAAMFMADSKLNISDKYLLPGLGFGGPCLSKDLRALVGDMRNRGLVAPLLGSVLESNQSHEDFLVARIGARVERGARLLLLGLTFKPGGSDLRNSPLVSLAQRLIDAGYRLDLYEPDAPAEAVRGVFPEQAVERLSPDDNWDLILFGKPPGDALAWAMAATPSIDLFRL